MNTAARPLTTVTAAAVAAMAGLIVTMGSASADDHGYDAHVRNDDTHNNTRTTVHNSGSGPVAVNVAGPHGDADQHLDQRRTDRSRVNVYTDKSRTQVRNIENSHNSERYRR